jgi:CRISPR/Cas system-associated endonuclease Cas1
MENIKNSMIDEKAIKLIERKIKKNEDARNNYQKRTINGTNKQVKNKEDYLKRGPKVKHKLIIVKNPVGRPTKDINEYLNKLKIV